MMSTSWHLRSIEIAEPRTYRASLTREGEHRTFTFRVELHRGFELVTWEPDFAELVAGSQRPGGEPLLAAILAFHMARELTVG
jgi:hypothetical protein